MVLDSEARTARNGSAMYGHMIQKPSAGANWTALAIYLLQEKVTPLPWSGMSCISLVGGLKKVPI